MLVGAWEVDSEEEQPMKTVFSSKGALWATAARLGWVVVEAGAEYGPQSHHA